MARHRSLTPRRSRSPPPRKRSDDRRRSPAPSGLLVRNVPLDTRSEDLRVSFERYGPVKDVYLPKNYHTREPRGFAFVKFRHPEDALEAKEQLNQTLIGGREIRIVFAEDNRKTPQEMQNTGIRYGGTNRRRTPSRSPRRRNRSYSRSTSPARHRSRSISRSSSPRRRPLSPKETSHGEKRYRSSSRSLSTKENAPHDGDYKYSKRSSLSREKVLRVERDHRHRLSRRSPSPRDFSPNVPHKKSEKIPFTPNRRSPDDATHTERKGKSNERAPLSDDSPDKSPCKRRGFSRLRS